MSVIINQTELSVASRRSYRPDNILEKRGQNVGRKEKQRDAIPTSKSNKSGCASLVINEVLEFLSSNEFILFAFDGNFLTMTLFVGWIFYVIW